MNFPIRGYKLSTSSIFNFSSYFGNKHPRELISALDCHKNAFIITLSILWTAVQLLRIPIFRWETSSSIWMDGWMNTKRKLPSDTSVHLVYWER